MRPPPKTWATRKRKLSLTKSQMVMIAGGVALLLYVILASVSGVYLGTSAKRINTEQEALELHKNCSDPTYTQVKIHEKLNHVIGETVRLIFWTWLVIIYVLTIMVYLVYTIAGWQESHTLGRAWCFVIGVITVLNFVPCSYIFTFGDIAVKEKVAYIAMLAVILVFRIVDLVMMLILLREIRDKRALARVRSMTPTVTPSTANPSMAEVAQPPASTVVSTIRVTPEPKQKNPGNPFEDSPPA